MSMQIRKWLALLVSAALALSLLAGCGNGESVARSLLNLLDGKYANVSVEMDPDLEADLRQAIRTAEAESENETDDEAAIRAALETLLGSTITFRYLGEGQQGDTAFDLIFYAGADPDKAAQAAYSQWNPIFSNVPDDGKYGTGLAMVETENGVWMLVKATVEKAGTEDKPEPAAVTGISVSTQPKKTQYNPGEDFDPDGMVITVTYSDGSTKIISSDYSSKGVTWSPANINADTTVTITYGGKTDTVAVKLITLESIDVSGDYQTEYKVNDSFNPTGMVVTAHYSDKSSIIISGSYDENGVTWEPVTFNTIGPHDVTITYTDDENRSKFTLIPVTVADIVVGTGYKFDKTANKATITGGTGLQELFDNSEVDALSATIILETDQTVTGAFGDYNNPFTGTLQSEAGKKYTITLSSKSGQTRTLGLFDQVGNNSMYGKGGGTVKNLKIQLAADISFTGDTQNCSGAVAGTNYGTIRNCDVDLNGYSITDTYGDGEGGGATCAVGGIVGWNEGTISSCSVSMGAGEIAAEYRCELGTAAAGGIAGSNTHGRLSDGTVTDCTVTGSGTITATLTLTPSSYENPTKIAAAGGLVGYNYSKGAVSNGLGSGSSITITATDGNTTKPSAGALIPETGQTGSRFASGVFAGTKIGYQVVQ